MDEEELIQRMEICRRGWCERCKAKSAEGCNANCMELLTESIPYLRHEPDLEAAARVCADRDCDRCPLGENACFPELLGRLIEAIGEGKD